MKRLLLFFAIVISVLSVSTHASAYLPDFGFESGAWGSWTSQGSENAVLPFDVFTSGPESSELVLPKTGNLMARVNSYNGAIPEGGEGEGAFNVFNNYITQSFVWGGEDLSFWYNYFTWDYYDLDSPGFVVYLDEEEILRWDAGDLDDTEGLDGVVNSTGWQQFIFTAEDFDDWGYGEGDEVSLWIYAGNTGDDEVPSWVYIDGERNVIPEPATMLLLGLGILGLAKFRRKK